jgi:hypothetical protein
MARLFRLRLRQSGGLHTFGLNPNLHYEISPDKVIIVSEDLAAHLLRHRTATFIETIDAQGYVIDAVGFAQPEPAQGASEEPL